jgi:extracellular elastinolytic metalloproteinase
MLVPIVSLVVASVINTAGVQGSTLPNGGQKVDVNKFRLQTTAEYVPSLVLPRKNGSSPTGLAAANYVKTATLFVKMMMPNATFRLVGDHYIGATGIGHVYFKQTSHALDIDNADFNVNVS